MCVAKGRHVWQRGGIRGEGGHVWQRGICMVGACMVGGMHSRGCVWQCGMHGRRACVQERRPLKQAARIIITGMHYFFNFMQFWQKMAKITYGVGAL